VIGIYTIWVLLKDETAKLFAEASAGGKREQVVQPQKGRGRLALPIVAIVAAVLFTCLSLLIAFVVAAGLSLFHVIGSPHETPVVSMVAAPVTTKVGQLDFPYGRPGYLIFGPEGPTLTDECASTLGLGSSQMMEVKSILGAAYTQYLELESRHTQRQQADGSLTVIISSFREEAQALLEQLWADLDSVLDEHQRAVARRHLPLGQIFGTFQFGEPEVTIAISKTGDTFVYTTQYKWPKGSDRSGGDTSGSGSTLPPEYQRFWNQTATDEKHEQSSSIHRAVPFSNWNFPDNPCQATSPGSPLRIILELVA
jgi:hypothetical protein